MRSAIVTCLALATFSATTRLHAQTRVETTAPASPTSITQQPTRGPQTQIDTNAPISPEAVASLARNGKREARVHDPSTIVKCKDQYWFFATGRGLNSWHSKDLMKWERGPQVFPTPPTWITNVVAQQRGSFWAPDVIFHDGRYLLYYSVSRFGTNTSAIALASNPTLDPADPNYQWTDHGIVVQSHEEDKFNTIDPSVIKTKDNGLWLSFGSFWSGIKLIQLDPATGKLLASGSPMYSLASVKEIEASYIYSHNDYYYLFVNWNLCCRGTNSTYNIRVGRSRKITGPYLDKDGVDMMNGGGTLLSATDGAFIGPGHAGIIEDGGKFWLSCHYYDGTQRGASMLAIRPMHWAADGWPVLDPANNSPSNPTTPR